MHKHLIAPVTLAVVVYFYLAGNAEPVSETALIESAPQQGVERDNRRTSPDTSAQSIPMPGLTITVQGRKSLSPLERSAELAHRTKSPPALAENSDEWATELLQLANYNKVQLYNALLHVLEATEPDSIGFREFTLATIEEMGDDAPGAVLAALVQNAPDPSFRLRALQLLNQTSQELLLDPFNLALGDHDPAIQQSAISSLDGMGTTMLLEVLTEAVYDSDQTVRLMAFAAMEEMYQFAPVWEIADLFVNDPDPQIRMRALELLTYGDQHIAIDRLVLALNDPDPEIRELAEDLLADLEQDLT